jgi:hypothetical protein
MLHDEEFDRSEYQSTPLQRIASLAVHEAMDLEAEPDVRQKAREWVAVHGYGKCVDDPSQPSGKLPRISNERTAS